MGLRLGAASGREAMETRTSEELSNLVTQITNEIDWLMHEDKLTRADLATRMGVSPGRISQVLSGGENLTLRTLAALATALDARFELELKPVTATSDDAHAPRQLADAHAYGFPGGDRPHS
jgi:transcriptional regulator with XRE-family HTH domain